MSGFMRIVLPLAIMICSVVPPPAFAASLHCSSIGTEAPSPANGPLNIGSPSGGCSIAMKVSFDGSVVAGVTLIDGFEYKAFTWSGGTFNDVSPGYSAIFVNGLSDAGTVVVGSVGYATDSFVWRNGVFQTYSGLYVGGVSGDGAFVVGLDVSTGQAFRMNAAGDVQGLGGLVVNGYSVATDANTDGSVIVGIASNGTINVAMYWSASLGVLSPLQGLNPLDYADAAAVNGDGSVIVGSSRNSEGDREATRWVDFGTAQGLGQIAGGDSSEALDVSKDGSVIVGNANYIGSKDTVAFRWTAVTGMKDLNALLVDRGVDMSTTKLLQANGVSGNGEFIVGLGTFGTAERAYIVRYCDSACPSGPIAGVTTAESVQASANALGWQRSGVMAQHHGLAQPLLGDDKPLDNTSEAGVFGYGGSAAGGGYTRLSNSAGFSILGGVSYGNESYDRAALDDSFMGALAVRYLSPFKGALRPFAEIGGWLDPEADITFERVYTNGSGTATGYGTTQGNLSYLFARAGFVFELAPGEQVEMSGEIGRERLKVEGYSESLSAGNPFSAVVSGGTDRMDIAKARLAYSVAFGGGWDATVWGAAVYGFNNETAAVTTVAGLGSFNGITDESLVWGEYGVRIGYAITTSMTLDTFIEGVSGEKDRIDTRVHGGAGLRFRF